MGKAGKLYTMDTQSPGEELSEKMIPETGRYRRWPEGRSPVKDRGNSRQPPMREAEVLD